MSVLRLSTSVLTLSMLMASSSGAQEMLVMGGAGRVARFDEKTGRLLVC